MRANPMFLSNDSAFWAYVRTVTEALGASRRGSGQVRAFGIGDLHEAMRRLGRSTFALGDLRNPTPLAIHLVEYFQYRADLLNLQVERDLQDAQRAGDLFEEVAESVGAIPLGPIVRANREVAFSYDVRGTTIRVPMNKQSGEMRRPNYLTGIVNLIVAAVLDGRPCDFDPQALPVIDHEGTLYAAMSRRMDGSMPSAVNPLAMWEIKEFYYTTSFGSKISDAVYITALDGYERAEIETVTQARIDHLIIIDAYYTWWVKGRSYLCRLIDLLHMGKVDHLLCGAETARELPQIVEQWAVDWDARH